MFWRKRFFLNKDLEDWHIECWAWLLRHMHGVEKLRKTPLVLPTTDFFSPTDAEGHARADHIFRNAKAYTPMARWQVKLEAQPEKHRRVNDASYIHHGKEVCGTFRIENDIAIISYDPGMLNYPEDLIAVFAHELGHFLNGQFPESPPGGWALGEPATDVTAAFLGFGVFSANFAFGHRAYVGPTGSTWASQRRGYITEREWVFALAIFSALARKDLTPAKDHLKKYLWNQLQRAVKYVEERQIAYAIITAV